MPKLTISSSITWNTLSLSQIVSIDLRPDQRPTKKDDLDKYLNMKFAHHWFLKS